MTNRKPALVSRIQSLFKRLKTHWIVTLLAALAAAVTAFGTFTDSATKIIQFTRDNFLPRKETLLQAPVIRTGSAREWSLTELTREASSLPYRFGYWEFDSHLIYSLALHIKAEFASRQFNTPSILESVARISLPQPKARKTEEGWRVPVEYHYERISEEPVPYLSWVIFAKFEDRPTKTDLLRFHTGLVAWEIPFGEIKWSPYTATNKEGRQFTWWAAQGSLDIRIPDPDWVVFHSTRIMPSTAKNMWLLGVTVQNFSSTVVAIDEINLDASHSNPLYGGCSAGPDYRAPTQSVDLRWERILASGGKDGARTKLSNMPIRVPATFVFAGLCNNWHFYAKVPVQFSIAPRELSQIIITMNEYPSKSPLATKSSDERGLLTWRTAPSRLKDWDTLNVTIKALQPVFPDQRKVLAP